MSADEQLEEFEKRTRALLEQSVTHVDARIRSRLNQARHAALSQLEKPQRAPWWRVFGVAPAAGVAAAVLVAVVLWGPRPGQMTPATEGASSAVEDLDLVADGETFDLIQQGDGGFYEWAVAQADAGPEATG
jgi:negative regulator of sigma E activity